MADPSEKSKEIEEFVDGFTKKSFGRTRTQSIRDDVCVFCGGPATDFRDELSKKEYTISGACQKCQDVVFESQGGGEDD